MHLRRLQLPPAEDGFYFFLFFFIGLLVLIVYAFLWKFDMLPTWMRCKICERCASGCGEKVDECTGRNKNRLSVADIN